jgi:hypothetical protein
VRELTIATEARDARKLAVLLDPAVAVVVESGDADHPQVRMVNGTYDAIPLLIHGLSAQPGLVVVEGSVSGQAGLLLRRRGDTAAITVDFAGPPNQSGLDTATADDDRLSRSPILDTQVQHWMSRRTQHLRVVTGGGDYKGAGFDCTARGRGLALRVDSPVNDGLRCTPSGWFANPLRHLRDPFQR